LFFLEEPKFLWQKMTVGLGAGGTDSPGEEQTTVLTCHTRADPTFAPEEEEVSSTVPTCSRAKRISTHITLFQEDD
jgi:hypothetical protein